VRYSREGDDAHTVSVAEGTFRATQGVGTGVSVPDDEDFSAYAAARWATLVRVASYLGASEPEDLVQSTLLRCYRSWGRVRRADRVDAYVHRALVNAHAKAGQRRWRGEVPTEVVPDHGQSDETEAANARADLLRALGSLSVDHRTVLVLRFVADLTEQQTAEALGVPLGTVKSRVSRALAAVNPADLVEEPRER